MAFKHKILWGPNGWHKTFPAVNFGTILDNKTIGPGKKTPALKFGPQRNGILDWLAWVLNRAGLPFFWNTDLFKPKKKRKEWLGLGGHRKFLP